MDALFMKPMHKAVWAQLRKRPLVGTEEHPFTAHAKQIEVEHVEDQRTAKTEP